MEYYSAMKKELLPFATTWMGIMLSEISQTKTNTVWYHLYVESKKYKKPVNITKKKQTHRYREEISGYQWGEGKDEGRYRSKLLKVQTVLYKISYKDILYNTGNIANIL